MHNSFLYDIRICRLNNNVFYRLDICNCQGLLILWKLLYSQVKDTKILTYHFSQHKYQNRIFRIFILGHHQCITQYQQVKDWRHIQLGKEYRFFYSLLMLIYDLWCKLYGRYEHKRVYLHQYNLSLINIFDMSYFNFTFFAAFIFSSYLFLILLSTVILNIFMILHPF